MKINKLTHIITVFLLLSGISCSGQKDIFKTADQKRPEDLTSSISGTINYSGTLIPSGNYIVELHTDSGFTNCVYQREVPNTGPYTIDVADGTYYIMCFKDFNGDRLYDSLTDAYFADLVSITVSSDHIYNKDLSPTDPPEAIDLQIVNESSLTVNASSTSITIDLMFGNQWGLGMPIGAGAFSSSDPLVSISPTLSPSFTGTHTQTINFVGTGTTAIELAIVGYTPVTSQVISVDTVSPTINSHNFPDAPLPNGTLPYTVNITFSEDVPDLNATNVFVDKGATLTSFTDNGSGNWTFKVEGLSNNNCYTVTLSSSIMDAADNSLTEQSFIIPVGQALYVKPGGNDVNNGFTPVTAKASINGALSDAFPGWKIMVAEGTYDGAVILVDGIMLHGGYSSDFIVQDPGTHITTITQNSNPDTIVANTGVTAATEIYGFTIENSFSSPATSTSGISCVDASPKITNNTINGGTGDMERTAIYLENSSSEISGNLISGGVNTDPGVIGPSYGIRISGGNPMIDNNEIFGGQGDTGAESYAIRNDSNDVVIINNYIHGGSGPYQAYGISSFTSGGGAIHISYNKIYSGTGNDSTAGIEIYTGGIDNGTIINNVIVSGSTTTSFGYGVNCNMCRSIFSNNTIAAGADTSPPSAAIPLYLNNNSAPSVTNNIIFIITGLGLVDGVAVIEQDTSGDAASFENNLLFNCASGLYFSENSLPIITDIDGVNLLDMELLHGGPKKSRYGNNISTAETPGTVFMNYSGADGDPFAIEDNDWHLDGANTPIVEGGKFTNGFDCGTHETPSSCGGVTYDLDHLLRPGGDPFYSIGAYEVP